MNTKRKTALRVVGVALLTLLTLVIGYVAYVVFSYSRIPDNLPLQIDGESQYSSVSLNKEYTIVTQNLGFGAYSADFTFFMDGGEDSIAESPESVLANINAGIDVVSGFSPDFILFQEIDIDSTRSYHINQYDMITSAFAGYQSAKAINYDSAFLMYPLTEPHGASYSSLATFSRYGIESSLRRSLPISTSFSKFLDLDRCYSVSRVRVDGGKELVIYNVHTSAYGSDESIRTAQITMLMNDMAAEYEKGNYVICGGDFNHDFTGTSTQLLNNGNIQLIENWAQPFPEELIPEGFSRCMSYSGAIKPTCRNCDVPYEEGNFTIIVDGFIISDNVECIEIDNVVTGFAYADHNPVVLKFRLIG